MDSKFSFFGLLVVHIRSGNDHPRCAVSRRACAFRGSEVHTGGTGHPREQLVGEDSLSEDQKCTLEAAMIIRDVHLVGKFSLSEVQKRTLVAAKIIRVEQLVGEDLLSEGQKCTQEVAPVIRANSLSARIRFRG